MALSRPWKPARQKRLASARVAAVLRFAIAARQAREIPAADDLSMRGIASPYHPHRLWLSTTSLAR